jgi:hypothetical protein
MAHHLAGASMLQLLFCYCIAKAVQHLVEQPWVATRLHVQVTATPLAT